MLLHLNRAVFASACAFFSAWLGVRLSQPVIYLRAAGVMFDMSTTIALVLSYVAVFGPALALLVTVLVRLS